MPLTYTTRTPRPRPVNIRMNKTAHVIIVGGGAAGMAAAIAAAKESPDLTVTVYEPNAVLGRKLYIGFYNQYNG